jgi:antitoxin HicB
MNKDLKYYLDLPWSYKIEWSDEDECYVASVAELWGCMSHGDTLEEAANMIKEALECHLGGMLKSGEPIEEPLNKKDFKGNITYRTSPEKHYKLARSAKRLGKPINTLIDEAVEEKFLKYGT